jgi:predicted SAM-dependent methyltransferase
VYFADIVSDASEATKLCPPGGVPFINACHSLEHMPVRGDAGVQELLSGWLGLLRPGGIMALVMPDNDHFDAMACDSDHKHAWGHSDFSRRVLDPLFFRVGLELVEYDTFDNHHSFNVVLRKLDDHQSEAK